MNDIRLFKYRDDYYEINTNKIKDIEWYNTYALIMVFSEAAYPMIFFNKIFISKDGEFNSIKDFSIDFGYTLNNLCRAEFDISFRIRRGEAEKYKNQFFTNEERYPGSRELFEDELFKMYDKKIEDINFVDLMTDAIKIMYERKKGISFHLYLKDQKDGEVKLYDIREVYKALEEITDEKEIKNYLIDKKFK